MNDETETSASSPRGDETTGNFNNCKTTTTINNWQKKNTKNMSDEDHKLLRDLEHVKTTVESSLKKEVSRCLQFLKRKLSTRSPSRKSSSGEFTNSLYKLSCKELNILLQTIRNLRQLTCSIGDGDQCSLKEHFGVSKSLTELCKRVSMPTASKILLDKNLFKLFYSIGSAFAKHDFHEETLEALKVCQSFKEALKVYDTSSFWKFLASTYEKLGEVSEARLVYQNFLVTGSSSKNDDTESLLHLLMAGDSSTRPECSLRSRIETTHASSASSLRSMSQCRQQATVLVSEVNVAPPAVHSIGPKDLPTFEHKTHLLKEPFSENVDARTYLRILACNRALDIRARLSESAYTNFDPVKYQLSVIQTYLLTSRPVAVPKVRQDVTAPEYWTLADWRGNVIETIMSPQSQAAIVSCHRVFASSSSDSAALSIFNHAKSHQMKCEMSDVQSEEGKHSISRGVKGSHVVKRPPALSSDLISMPLVSISQ